MISETTWKGFPAVFLENGQLRAVVLPSLGGKIASLYHRERDFELAAQPGRAYRLPVFGADFSQFDAAGLDDAFPSIVSSVQQQRGRAILYPDHGEIWSASLTKRVEGERLSLTYESQNLPYFYQKIISLEGGQLSLKYYIRNTGKEAFPYIWMFHGLVRYEEDMELLFPPGAESVINVLEGTVLGKLGQCHPIHRGERPLSRLPARESQCCYKFYLNQPLQKGCCGYRYPTQGMQSNLLFPEKQLPYLGFWATAGGYRGEYNCAFEPTNAFYDCVDTARANNALPVLQPGEELAFSLQLLLKCMV